MYVSGLTVILELINKGVYNVLWEQDEGEMFGRNPGPTYFLHHFYMVEEESHRCKQ